MPRYSAGTRFFTAASSAALSSNFPESIAQAGRFFCRQSIKFVADKCLCECDKCNGLGAILAQTIR